MFHEFGHALQHMMTQQAEGLVAGIRGVEWDAVELPSQFMENWCYNRATLNTFGRHYETGEPLPEDLYKRLVAARTFRQATKFSNPLLSHFLSVSLYTLSFITSLLLDCSSCNTAAVAAAPHLYVGVAIQSKRPCQFVGTSALLRADRVAEAMCILFAYSS